jgi:hypothetical protein
VDNSEVYGRMSLETMMLCSYLMRDLLSIHPQQTGIPWDHSMDEEKEMILSSIRAKLLWLSGNEGRSLTKPRFTK